MVFVGQKTKAAHPNPLDLPVVTVRGVYPAIALEVIALTPAPLTVNAPLVLKNVQTAAMAPRSVPFLEREKRLLAPPVPLTEIARAPIAQRGCVLKFATPISTAPLVIPVIPLPRLAWPSYLGLLPKIMAALVP